MWSRWPRVKSTGDRTSRPDENNKHTKGRSYRKSHSGVRKTNIRCFQCGTSVCTASYYRCAMTGTGHPSPTGHNYVYVALFCPSFHRWPDAPGPLTALRVSLRGRAAPAPRSMIDHHLTHPP